MSTLEFDEQAARQLTALYDSPWAARRRRLLREALAPSPGETVVDVGCGPGFYCAELSDDVGREGTVIGVDSSGASLAAAARRCAGLANVELKEGEATALPLADRTAEAVLSVQVLEYVEEIGAALAEMRRVLRPGGRLLLFDTDWATLSWYSAQPERMRRVLTVWDEHLVHRSLPQTLGRELRRAGFGEIVMTPHPVAVFGSQPDADPGTGMTPLITEFVRGRGSLGDGELEKWAAEQDDLRRSGDYYYACLQAYFTARRPAG